MAEAGMEVGEDVRRELIFVAIGQEVIHLPVRCPDGRFAAASINLVYDPRLGIRWGTYGNTTFYSAVK